MGSIGIRASEGKGVNVNGAEIYHEVRGSGPPVLFIQGATGDGGTFEQVANLLADEFTVVTYHRRGNSLSPPPAGWASTSTEEQANDAVALLEALSLAPAAVFGTSSGAIIGLDLVIRHPEAVRGAILHEPPMMSVLARPEEVMGPIRQMVEESMKRGGPRAAVEAFVRFAAGDENFENLDPGLRERMLGNGETLFGIEFGTFESYRPTDEALAEVEVPVQVAIGTESAPFFGEAVRWLADRLDVEVAALTGGHTPYLDHPVETADEIRPFLRQVSQPELSARVQPGREKAMNRKTLQHEVTGQGDPIVLVPGGLSGWLSWIPFAERLVAGRTVVRVQLRSVELAEAGEPFPDDYGTLTEREALRATVDKLGLDSFDLVGWSYGGHVSLAFALEYPERVRTLTLIEPPAVWVLRETGHAASALAQSEAVDRSTAGKDITLDDLKGFLVRAGFGEPGDDFESLPQWSVWVRNRQVISANGKIWDYTDSLDRLRALKIPVLAVKGTETTEDLAAIVDDLVATVLHGRLLELPGGHACHIENIDRFLDELARHTATMNR